MKGMLKAGVALVWIGVPGIAFAQQEVALPAEQAPAAQAAEAEPADGLADIVVTAQKRRENVQDIPIAITAVGGDTLQERQVTAVDQLATVAPSVNFGTYGGAARIAIRGIGFDTINPGSEGRIAYHVDGVYVSRPSAQLGTFFDVDRVEVLRGPQGTLYGRNATGGSINVVTRAPTTTPSGYANLTIGNYGRVGVEAALSGPIDDEVSARIAVVTNNRSGYGRNEATGNRIDDANQRGARAALRARLGSNLTIDLSADYYREKDNAYGLHYFGQYDPAVPLRAIALGGVASSELRNISADSDPTNNRELYGYSSTISLDLGGATLKSITAYRHSDYHVMTELDMTSRRLSIFSLFERARQVSQELQLSGEFGRSNWLVGAYYFNENIFGGSQVSRSFALTGGADVITNGYRVQGDTRTRAVAVFGQLDLALTDKFKVIAGARYNREKIAITDVFQLDFVRPYTLNAPIIPQPGFPRSDDTVNHAFTPKLGLEYKASRDLLLYASESKGFKSGGYNLGINVPAFKPEDIWSYEAGLKFTSADRKLRANLAAFYYDYTNLQVSKVFNSAVITENAAEAEMYGGELELTYLPTDGFQIDGGLSFLHSEYKKFSSLDPARPALGVLTLDGNTLTQAPKFTANVGAQYKWMLQQGDLTLRGELNHSSRVYFTAFNVDSVGQAANTKFNAFLTWSADQNWTASLFVRNITDRVTRANGLVSAAVYGSPITGSVSPPRTFGAMLGYRF